MTKAQEIKNQITQLSNQLEEIQKDCTHENTKIKFSEEKKGVFKFCEDCQSYLRYATQEELKENGFTK